MSLENLKQLREQTGISMLECKKALEEAKGDVEKAKKVLREKGKEMIKGREGRGAAKGFITSYIHPGAKIGVLLELNCESDFVAKSEDFQKLAHEICLQITASRPLFVREDDIDKKVLDDEKKIYAKQMADSGKSKEIINKVVEGKLAKYKKEVSLLSQPWVKESNKTVQDLIDEARAKIGENIEVGKFARYEI